MIVLDTNVVSEVLRPQPSRAVVAWLDRQDVENLFLTAISLAELRYGLAALPDGRRKEALTAALEENVFIPFGKRILVFDATCAAAYATVRSRAARSGKAIAAADGYIAAIALVHGFMVATCDTALFRAAGLSVIDPWAAD